MATPGAAPDISHPKLHQLYEYWAERRGDRAMPARADLDPIDMAFVIGNVILVDVIEGNPPRFRIRLHGTNLSQRVGFELTGKMLDEMPWNEFRKLSEQSFAWVATRRQVLHRRSERLLDDRLHRYEVVIHPLSSDGERVDMLLCGLIYDDSPR